MQSVIVALFTQAQDWTSEFYVQNLSGFQLFSSMLALYIKFHAFGYNLDIINNSGVVQEILEGMLKRLDSDYFPEVQALV